MPFTLAHPIAILPIWLGSRKQLHLPGLILGAMIPDWEYFLALRPSGTIGHTTLGILIQGIPASIGLLLLLRYGLAQPLLALLPPRYAVRFPSPDGQPFWRIGHLANLCLAITIGAFTHIVWDSFTHPTGWFVRHLPLLQTKFLFLPIYKILQYSGGIFGLLALLIWFVFWFQQAQPQPPSNDRQRLTRRHQVIAWVVILTIAAIFSGIAIQRQAYPEDGLAAMIVRAVIGGISGLVVGMGVYAIGFWLVMGKKTA
jgi:Domain of unknown function (DUF4184)